jgi:hypothetical protein
MDATAKVQLKSQLAGIAAQQGAIKAMASASLPPAISGQPGVPIVLDPSFSSIKDALRLQVDSVERILKFLNELVDKS